jgi:hypothetical protein
MDDTPLRAQAPAGWLEALDRSEAQLAAGETVPGEEVMRELDKSIARLEAKRASKPKRKITPRR